MCGYWGFSPTPLGGESIAFIRFSKRSVIQKNVENISSNGPVPQVGQRVIVPADTGAWAAADGESARRWPSSGGGVVWLPGLVVPRRKGGDLYGAHVHGRELG